MPESVLAGFHRCFWAVVTKLFFVIGHVALETLVYAEEFDRKVKRRRHEREIGSPAVRRRPEIKKKSARRCRRGGRRTPACHRASA